MKNKYSIHLTLLGIIFVFGFLIYYKYEEAIHARVHSEQNRLLGITKTLSVEISADDISTMLNPDSGEELKKVDDFISDYLKRTAVTNSLDGAINLLAFSTDNVYIICSSKDFEGRRKEYLRPPQGLLTRDVGGELAPFMDENGLWIAAFTSIKNGEKTVAVLQATTDYNNFFEKIKVDAVLSILLYTIVSIVFAVILILYVFEKNQLVKTNLILKNAQKSLIESEKMASLGVLISGVTHEVNTPLGVLTGSLTNIYERMESMRNNFVCFAQQAKKEDWETFGKLLELTNPEEIILSSREERQIKRNLRNLFEEYNISFLADKAFEIIKMGLHDKIDELLINLKGENGECVFDSVCDFAMVNSNMHHMSIALKKMQKIIFALKNYSHHENSESVKKTKLTEGIDTVLTLYYNQVKTDIDLNKNFKDTDTMIECVPDEVDQVWTNLLSNAIQAMGGKGTLTVNHYKKKNTLVVEVIDSGPGIPKDIQNNIFDPFFTTKQKGQGTGLGLDICKKIVEKYNGELKVDSVPGETKFTVKFKL